MTDIIFLWRDEHDELHADSMQDWVGHCLPSDFRLFPEPYEQDLSAYEEDDYYWNRAYQFPGHGTPKWFRSLVNADFTYEEACGVLSWLEAGYGDSIAAWCDEGWACLPPKGNESEREDIAYDYVRMRWTMPDNFDPHFIDADYVIDYMLRFDTETWYEDDKSHYIFYR